VCPACGTTLEVDVQLLGLPTDPRLRYELTKRLNERGPLNVDLGAEFKVKGRPVKVAHRVTREFAMSVGQVLANAKVEFELVPVAASMSVPADRTEGGTRRRVGQLMALLIVVAAGGLAWTRLGAEQMRLNLPSVADVQHGLQQLQPTRSTSLADAVKSVVSVRCPNSVGSGFYVASDLIVTNNHVLCTGAERMTVVQPSGKETIGEVVQRDEKHDLALVRVKLEGPPLTLADAASAELGSEVGVIGSPRGLDFTVHRGNLSFVGRATGGVGYLQIDSAINPGNSGGPVLDSSGRVIGVVTAILKNTEGIGFAVPVNYLVSGSSPIWPAGPHELVTEPWKAFDERTRGSAGERLGAHAPAGASTVPDDFTLGLSAARFLSFKRGTTPDLQVVVVTTDAHDTDRRWTFELMIGDQSVCTLLRTKTVAWVRLESNNPNLKREFIQELVDRHLDQKLYVGVMNAQWSSCPEAYSHDVAEFSLELPGAPKGYSRVGLTWR
jgi:S1-C subfamily serine protease